ncbi:MAG: DUF3079 domain-containing protein [Comamonadaceae bacterium]|jgi:hypothetical protein|nr:DUF3079 domain-containing protein [Comamonadaceae bacterium]
MSKKFPIKPAHPERVCWGCDRYCAADALQCGNGSVATPHPSDLFGDDWQTWGLDAANSPNLASHQSPASPDASASPPSSTPAPPAP